MPLVYPPANSSIVWFDLFGPQIWNDLDTEHCTIARNAWTPWRNAYKRLKSWPRLRKRIVTEGASRETSGRKIALCTWMLRPCWELRKCQKVSKENTIDIVIYIIHCLFVKNPWIADSWHSEAVTALPGQLRPAVRLRSLPRRRHSAGPGQWKQKRQLHGWRR